MSIILGVLIKGLSGKREMIFASDGRVLEHGTKNIRNEDYDKIKRLGPKTCMGYAGHSGELFTDVFNELKNKMRKMKFKDLLFVSSKLKATILEMLKTQRHKEFEEHFGPLNHQFIIGGLYNKKLRLNTLFSVDGFLIKKDELLHPKNILVKILGSTEEVQQEIKKIGYERLKRPQSFDEVVENIKYIISKVAEQTHDINNHIFVRRLSTNFELERYIGHK